MGSDEKVTDQRRARPPRGRHRRRRRADRARLADRGLWHDCRCGGGHAGRNHGGGAHPGGREHRSRADATRQRGRGTEPGRAAGCPLGKAAAVPVGGGTVFAAAKVVVTQPQAGTYVGLSAICTHMGCTVRNVSGGTINCPCHGSMYHLDGTVARGPAPRALAHRSVTVVDGDLRLG